MNRPAAPIILVAGLAATLAGCGNSLLQVDRCFIRLARVIPEPVDVAVGASIPLSAAFNTTGVCLPADASLATVRWTSADPAVARIDSLTGVVTGVTAGQTTIEVRTSPSHTFLTSTAINVSAP